MSIFYVMLKYKYLLATFVLIFTLIIVLLSLYLYLFRFGSIAFISLHPKYKWQIDEGKIVQAVSTLGKIPTYMGKAIVVLSPKFKETDLSASAPPSKEAIPVDDYVVLYYGQWKKYGPFDALVEADQYPVELVNIY